ncbi:hypothetical protein LSTR_LSTR016211 [Laodelphax striatellus]|uniref:Uncharacterized protein n=1 Tax=Laodelphax striatellus TaxID=195883 RepID=A0A482XIH9_LAOST|nr:hypothetical protein LSTR_LSTR003788 [Laodelphax striatellus]RZF45319.1 hypothetical protein LSTR_LSTR016211 [Laodelphax striatellus]
MRGGASEQNARSKLKTAAVRQTCGLLNKIKGEATQRTPPSRNPTDFPGVLETQTAASNSRRSIFAPHRPPIIYSRKASTPEPGLFFGSSLLIQLHWPVRFTTHPPLPKTPPK